MSMFIPDASVVDVEWHKSSYSGAHSDCVEVADVVGSWHKSSYSGGGSGGGDCVEVAPLEHATAVRDSKDPSGPALVFAADAWSVFLDNVKVGRYS